MGLETTSSRKGERGKEEGRSFFFGSAKGVPERAKGPGEQGSHLGLNLQGAEIRLLPWEETAGAPDEGRKGFMKSAGADRKKGNLFSDHG
jgi:hypothetical protein